MQKLCELIDSLDGKPLTKYTALYGHYTRGDIVYSIANVFGGQVKSCSAELIFPMSRLFGDYPVAPRDRIAASAYLLREFSVCAALANNTMEQSESKVEKGMFLPYRYGQRVLETSAVRWDDAAETVSVSLTVRLPLNKPQYSGGKSLAGPTVTLASKNHVISARAVRLLFTKNLPQLAETFLGQFDMDGFLEAVLLYRDQCAIRAWLAKNGYVSFIGNGAILPRRGKTDFKEPKNAVPFQSPPSMEVEIPLPSGSAVRGIGIPCGVTVITGDAYHGKSTLLDAVYSGIYNHIPGDGREYVITDDTAMTIRAEDCRSVRCTDISFFLKNLPVAVDPRTFTTDNASGSTSQAAAVAEAVESGCRLMLFDEDRSANNFMYKDAAMRAVIPEAATRPFTDNARMLYRTFGISSVLVVGASGEAFGIADHVILVNRFAASEYTGYIRQDVPDSPEYHPAVRTFDLRRLREFCMDRRLTVQDTGTVTVGREPVNLADILPHATRGQLDFIVSFLYFLTVMERPNTRILRDAVTGLYRKIARNGINMIRQDGLCGASAMEFVRMQDMLAILYRLRCVEFRSPASEKNR